MDCNAVPPATALPCDALERPRAVEGLSKSKRRRLRDRRTAIRHSKLASAEIMGLLGCVPTLQSCCGSTSCLPDDSVQRLETKVDMIMSMISGQLGNFGACSESGTTLDATAAEFVPAALRGTPGTVLEEQCQSARAIQRAWRRSAASRRCSSSCSHECGIDELLNMGAAISPTSVGDGSTDDDRDPDLAEAIAMSLQLPQARGAERPVEPCLEQSAPSGCHGVDANRSLHTPMPSASFPSDPRDRLLEGFPDPGFPEGLQLSLQEVQPVDEDLPKCSKCGGVIRGFVVQRTEGNFHFGCSPPT